MVAVPVAADAEGMTMLSETEDSIRSGSIVIAVDGSALANQAVAWGAEEARLSQRPVTIVHAEKPLGSQERAWLAQAGVPLTQIHQEMRTNSTDLLDRARTVATTTAPAVETSVVLRVGDPRQILLDLADDASMIVLGSRGRGTVSSLLLGSVSVAVSRHATCPVVVVRPRQDAPRLRGVLVGTDCTEHSTATLETAFREASYHDLPLTVVYCQWEAVSTSHGWRPVTPNDPYCDSARQRVADALAGFREKFPDVAVSAETYAGHVDDCLADLSREHDLTVIGRHAHGLLGRLASLSVATAVVEQASGPVVVVP
jgi:nucleotide-binding universal stress UspA family protein